jgi:hypothetical protein
MNLKDPTHPLGATCLLPITELAEPPNSCIKFFFFAYTNYFGLHTISLHSHNRQKTWPARLERESLLVWSGPSGPFRALIPLWSLIIFCDLTNFYTPSRGRWLPRETFEWFLVLKNSSRQTIVCWEPMLILLSLCDTWLRFAWRLIRNCEGLMKISGNSILRSSLSR